MNYKLTEHGLVAKFQQPCGCNAEGPSRKCQVGQSLFKAMSKDTEKYFNGEMSLAESDKSLTAWQRHLGA